MQHAYVQRRHSSFFPYSLFARLPIMFTIDSRFSLLFEGLITFHHPFLKEKRFGLSSFADVQY